MTEDEAEERWCPFVRHGDENSIAANRWRSGDKPEVWNSCWASKCMMWRIESVNIDTGIQHGYCGLAGQKDS